jgi:uncharacterized repeat protein (TIGR03917 family)
MTIVASAHSDYEVEVPIGTSVAELIRTLVAVPAEAVLTDHFGDVDLVAVFHLDRPASA